MIYEITDTNIEMKDTLGNKLGFHPVYAVEADSSEAALQAWKAQHGRGTEGVTVKEVTA